MFCLNGTRERERTFLCIMDTMSFQVYLCRCNGRMALKMTAAFYDVYAINRPITNDTLFDESVQFIELNINN